MKNTIGTAFAVTLFGESHGEEIGVVIDSPAPGFPIDREFIDHQLSLRRPQGKISTARQEKDEYRIVSGCFEGRATGTPLTIIIPNTNTKSKDYSKMRYLARPSHADYTAEIKYHGFQDYRGGGHFSGRITTPLVAAGAIAIKMLESIGITVGTHISNLGGVSDRSFDNTAEDIKKLSSLTFPVLDDEKAKEMREITETVASEGDSIGGVLETIVTGLPAGIGEPWFDTVESELAHILFSVPGIKGVEFGAGFGFADMKGSAANDAFRMDGDRVVTSSNNNGGINGGITNGMPVVFRCAVKPTPSIYKEQNTVDISRNENAQLQIEGRHDPAIIHRARVVVDSVTAITLVDIIAKKYGIDRFGGTN